DVAPYARARGTELDDVAGLERERRPARRLPAVDRHGRVGTGDRNRARRLHLEARPDQRALEGRRAVGVADEAVGEDEGEPVHRAGRRDAVAKLTGPAEVLYGRLGPWVEDPDHVVTGA